MKTPITTSEAMVYQRDSIYFKRMPNLRRFLEQDNWARGLPNTEGPAMICLSSEPQIHQEMGPSAATSNANDNRSGLGITSCRPIWHTSQEKKAYTHRRSPLPQQVDKEDF